MNEKLIEKKLGIAVKKCKGLTVKFWPLSFSGFPDRIVLIPGGRIWFVELKTTGKTLSPKQKIVHLILARLGFPVKFIDTQILLDEFINEFRK